MMSREEQTKERQMNLPGRMRRCSNIKEIGKRDEKGRMAWGITLRIQVESEARVTQECTKSE